jgi:hypothetical protein
MALLARLMTVSPSGKAEACKASMTRFDSGCGLLTKNLNYDIMNKELTKKIEKLVSRLESIGIEVKLGLNYPWIYLNYVNNRAVKEIYYGDHGFTVAFANQPNWLNLRRMFKIIRKYR